MLKFSTWTFALIVLLAGCSPQRSTEYEEILKTPRENWVEYAKKLPLEKRFSVYSQVYDASGYPKDSLLADSFTDSGVNGFDEAISLMTNRGNFFKFLPIVYSVSRGGNFNICSKENLQKIFLSAKKANLEKSEIDSINFRNCEINM